MKSINLGTKLAKPNESIREHTDKLHKEAKRLLEFDYISKEIFELLNNACEYHDYGKVNYRFQNRIINQTKFNEHKEIPHNILSMFFIPEDKFTDEDYYIVMMAVIYHHRLREKLEDILQNKYEIIKDNLKEYEKYNLNLEEPDLFLLDGINQLINEKNPKALIVKGLLHKCDYSASAGMPSEFKNDFLTEKLSNLLKKWRKKDPAAEWKELQKFCMDYSEKNLIVTAPTGMGKTEAGLWWIGNHKGFFILPLRTAINAMYDRINSDILKGEDIEKRLGLLHSDMKAYYLNDESVTDNIERYMECTKQMCLPLTISTMDQIFDFVFQYPGYEYKLAQLSYSKIVIDEIQMYDTRLLAFLIYGIERIHQVGGKVAVLTATLPPFVESELKNALGGEFIQKDYSNQGIERHNVKVFDKQINSEDIREKYEELSEKEKSAKILVVCNSIENAQNLYHELSDLNTKLLHSKFIGKHRKDKEKEILECGRTFSKQNPERIDKRHEIWISTSLVEASLDIDFDYLFTELNDVFSLFQRFGRCNRKGVKKWYRSETNCFVYLKARGSVKTFLEQSDIYHLSVEAMEMVDGRISELQKKDIIDTYFSEEVIRDTDYAKDYRYTKQIIDKNPSYECKTEIGEKLRDISAVDVIPISIYEEYQNEIEYITKKINDKSTTSIERISLLAEFKEYCLSVQTYEKKQCNELQAIALGRNWNIPIIDCEYTAELGFVKNKNKLFEEERLRNGGIFID